LTVQLGIALIPATAPDFFTEDMLVRQVLGAVAQFEKTSLVAKLRAARDRKKAATSKRGGRRSYFELARMLWRLTGGGNRRCSGGRQPGAPRAPERPLFGPSAPGFGVVPAQYVLSLSRTPLRG
jgi:hypothetical protein